MQDQNGGATTVQAVDPEGEVLVEGSETGEDKESLLEQVVADADARARRIAPLSLAEIKKVRESGREPIEIGVMGWFAKVGAGKTRSGKVILGSRLVGQIVASLITKGGKFGPQQAVVVYGVYDAPAHKNRQGVNVPEVKSQAGRWLVGIDSTLSELPSCVGEVVSIEMKKAAIPGTGQRHTYERVDLYTR